MHRIQFIHQPHPDGARSLRAVLASCTFHGLALGLLLALTFLYRSEMPPPKSGSAPGSASISLEKIIVVSPPVRPAPPQPPKPATASIPLRAPEAKPPSPEAAVPLLAAQPVKPALSIPAKTQAAIHPVISHPTVATAQSSPPQPAAPATPSSYAPGLSVLPHPPYPVEARDRGLTGTVVVNVHFNAQGDVARAEVAQSSGVPILDSETRSFIRANWHSPAYAGQTVSVPVQYTLQNL
jgi:protein TonB